MGETVINTQNQVVIYSSGSTGAGGVQNTAGSDTNNLVFDYDKLIDLLEEKGIDELYEQLKILEENNIISDLLLKNPASGKTSISCVYQDITYEFIENKDAKIAKAEAKATELNTQAKSVFAELDEETKNTNTNITTSYSYYFKGLNSKSSDEAKKYLDLFEQEIEKLQNSKEKISEALDRVKDDLDTLKKLSEENNSSTCKAMYQEIFKKYSSYKIKLDTITNILSQYENKRTQIDDKIKSYEEKEAKSTELNTQVMSVFSELSKEAKNINTTIIKCYSDYFKCLSSKSSDEAKKYLDLFEEEIEKLQNSEEKISETLAKVKDDLDTLKKLSEENNSSVCNSMYQEVLKQYNSYQTKLKNITNVLTRYTSMKTSMNNKINKLQKMENDQRLEEENKANEDKSRNLNTQVNSVFTNLADTIKDIDTNKINDYYNQCINATNSEFAKECFNSAEEEAVKLQQAKDEIFAALNQVKADLDELKKLSDENESSVCKSMYQDVLTKYNTYETKLSDISEIISEYEGMKTSMTNKIKELEEAEKPVEDLIYNPDGTLRSRINRSENGNYVSTSTFQYDSNSDKVTETVTDKDGKIINVIITYTNSDGVKVHDTRNYDDKQRCVSSHQVITYSDRVETIDYTIYTNQWLTASLKQEYNDGKVVSYTYEYPDLALTDDKTALAKNGTYSFVRTCNNGDKYSETRVNGKATVASSYSKEQNKTWTSYYNEEGKIYKSTTNVHSNGDFYTYTYTTPGDNKNYSILIEHKNGNWESYEYKNGKKVSGFQYNASTGAIKTLTYDSNENLVTAKSKLTGSMTKAGITLSAQQIYQGITNLDANLFRAYLMWWTGADCVKMIAGDISLDLLRRADKDNISKYPATYKAGEYPSEYKDFLETYLAQDCSGTSGCQGYSADLLKGYKFNSSSDIAKAITSYTGKITAGGKTYNGYSAFINAYKDKLDQLPSTISFEEGDLYYSLHGVSIAPGAYKDSNGKVHITFADIYDFNANASDMLNKVGAAAMADGELVPYYMLIDVVK